MAASGEVHPQLIAFLKEETKKLNDAIAVSKSFDTRSLREWEQEEIRRVEKINDERESYRKYTSKLRKEKADLTSLALKKAQLRGIEPNFKVKSITDLETEIKARDRDNPHKFEAYDQLAVQARWEQHQHVKNANTKEIEWLTENINDLKFEIECDRCLPEYQRYAATHKLEVDELTIFKVCNNHRRCTLLGGSNESLQHLPCYCNSQDKHYYNGNKCSFESVDNTKFKGQDEPGFIAVTKLEA